MPHSRTRVLEMSDIWPRIALIYLGGVTAAAGVGKISVVGTLIRSDLGLSLSQVAWAASVLLAVSAVAGLPCGLWIGKFGPRRSLTLGLAVMAVAGAGGAIAGSFMVLLCCRLIEGAGYLLVTVSAPILIIRLCDGKDRVIALSTWGTFMPVGLAISTVAGGLVGSSLGWRAWIGIAALLPAVLATVTWLAVPEPAPYTTVDGPRLDAFGRPMLLAAGFGLLSMVTVSVMVLFPSFVSERYGTSPATAGTYASSLSAASIAGGPLAGLALRRGAVRLRQMATAELIIIPAAWLVFRQGGSLITALCGGTVIFLANEMLIATVFAYVPVVGRGPRQANAVNGLVAQVGSLGALVGPPLFGAAVDWAGWPLLVALIGAGIAASASLLLGVRLDPARNPATLG